MQGSPPAALVLLDHRDAKPANAQLSGGSSDLSSILGTATDNALDKLAQPGAFYGDEAVRIGLPIVGRQHRADLLGSRF